MGLKGRASRYSTTRGLGSRFWTRLLRSIVPRHLKRRLVRNPRVADLGRSARSFFRQRATLDRKRIVMESICTAETAEDAEIAPLRPSAISAVSAVPPAFGPRILWKKMPGIFHGKIARFIAVAVDDSQSPNQSLQRTRGSGLRFWTARLRPTGPCHSKNRLVRSSARG